MTPPTKREYWFHRHPKLALSVSALVGCASLIILAELSARALFPNWAPTREERVKFWVYDELLGWAHTPNQRARFNHPDFSVEVVTNSQGMRDSEYTVERTGRSRMLVLGDSFGWGFGVEHNERFSEILENTHHDWEIINASVSGYGTDQEFLFLKEKGIALRPDVVLLLFYENDFDNNVHAEQCWYFKPYFVIERGQLQLRNVPVPKGTIRQKLHRFLAGRMYLGSRIHVAKRCLLALFEPLVRRETGSTEKEPGDTRGTYDVTHYMMRGMNELCKTSGSLFVLVSVPMNTQKTAFLEEIAEEQKIPYLPLDAQFKSTPTCVTFPTDGHWNAAGHRSAAKAIDTFLWTSGLLDASNQGR